MRNVRHFVVVMVATSAVVAVLVGMLAVVVGAAGANSVPEQPLALSAASLVQDGQDLVWQVELAQPFSPGALRGDKRSLCLLIERASNAAVLSEVCLAGPRRGERSPTLLYAPITRTGPGASVAIQAAVTRSSDRELSATFLPASVGLQYRPLRWQAISTVSAPGCTPATPGTDVCSTVFPTILARVTLHTPHLVGCVATGPDWVFTGPRKVREIALTFDDGPWWEPPTADFVNELARLHVPATFFEIGEHIPTYDPHGTIERQMLADGDMIGDHTWSHPDMVGLSEAEQRQQISLAAAAIKKATGGFEPCLFRAPDGAVDPSPPRRWRARWASPRSSGTSTLATGRSRGENEIFENVLANAHDGGIVEEHFGGGPRYETLDALPEEVAGLRKRGYQLVTLTQMLGYRLVYR